MRASKLTLLRSFPRSVVPVRAARPAFRTRQRRGLFWS